MITIKRLLLREFLIIGGLAVVLLLGARGLAELWILRGQATQQADSGLKLLADGLYHQTQDAEELGDVAALMWRRGEVAPDKPGTELVLEGLLRQSRAQSVFLTDVQGHPVSAENLDGIYSTRSLVGAEGARRVLARHWDQDGRAADGRILDITVPDLTQRPWYRRAVSSDSPSWTAPYLFISPPMAGVTYCRKVEDASGRLLGAVGVDLRLDALDQLARKYKPTPHALAYLATEGGQVLTGQDRASGGTPAVFQAVLATEGATDGWPIIRADRQFWLVHRDRMEGTGWNLLVAIPVDDLVSKPRHITMVALLLAFFTILMIAARLAAVSRRISLPLIELAKSSEGLLAGRSIPLPPTDIHELAQARDALMSASAGMQERHKLELEIQRVQRLDLVGTHGGRARARHEQPPLRDRGPDPGRDAEGAGRPAGAASRPSG
jgi:hypothetical protein